MSDATGVAEALLGLPGFRVLDAHESPAELVIEIETTAERVGCPDCGVVARAHERITVEYRDLAAFGRPARLRWTKRRWRCEEPACATRTWTESSPAFSARCLLTNRAGAECCRQVGRNARPVTQMAHELGVCWDTVMDAVRDTVSRSWMTRAGSARWPSSGSMRPRSWRPPRTTRPSSPPAWWTSDGAS